MITTKQNELYYPRVLNEESVKKIFEACEDYVTVVIDKNGKRFRR